MTEFLPKLREPWGVGPRGSSTAITIDHIRYSEGDMIIMRIDGGDMSVSFCILA